MTLSSRRPAERSCEHDFRHAAGEKDLHGGEVARAVGKRVDEARDEAIDLNPVRDGGALKARGMGDGGQMEEQVGGTAEGSVENHGVAQSGWGEDVADADAELMQAQKSAGRAAGRVEPDGLA